MVLKQTEDLRRTVSTSVLNLLAETQSKYEEAMKEVLSVQKQMKLGLVSTRKADTYHTCMS